MKGVHVVARIRVNNLAELIAGLQKLSNHELHTEDNREVTINGGTLAVTLELQTLTDGSSVYNLNLE